MAADELPALLDKIFSAFDRLADAEGVEKIKTIGDAYMVACGLPELRPDHLEAVAGMAPAMRDEIAAIAERPSQRHVHRHTKHKMVFRSDASLGVPQPRQSIRTER
jgi:class 3 adenylate cyclase